MHSRELTNTYRKTRLNGHASKCDKREKKEFQQVPLFLLFNQQLTARHRYTLSP